MKSHKVIMIAISMLALLILAGCGNAKSAKEHRKITIYKSPNCGCCVGWASYLEKSGFEVEIVKTNEIASMKTNYGIPANMESCHTAKIGKYFVEGHVPVEAIEKLLKDSPEIDGITLPGMPAGTPGMPGTKRGTWTIYAIKDGKASKFMDY